MSSTNQLPPPCAPEIAESLGLTGLTVYPIPETDLAATISRYARERRRQLEDGTSVEDTLIFTGATIAHVNALYPEDGDQLRLGHLTFFGDKSGLLFITMPGPVHNAADMELFSRLIAWVSNMGLLGNCKFRNFFKDEDVVDVGNHWLRPNPPRQQPDCLPTLVIETGNSQSPVFLKRKDWWFDISPPNTPRGDVKVVITITVYSPKKRIVLEEWRRNCQTPTRSILTKPNPETASSTERENSQTHWIVEGGPLRIKFEDVFLRPKEGQESDFILDEQALKMLALEAWADSDEMGFLREL